ncbi:SH3 domain-containing protein [Paeniglutamicibacter gangotriensis]|uniref:SH3b domain-containing protein n=1 Tax=Paeniglutamicibacter gangotriensis Lz1y TaxID=1276920 RepID=M7MLT1_9MICC|nr:hypothetical protein [Paeniglutamicibacter gangotriensis]EMQ97262.1 hypothetical protein ADIAG_03429 [Paeniglutamicibacter gangotriensis Lz1y]
MNQPQRLSLRIAAATFSASMAVAVLPAAVTAAPAPVTVDTLKPRGMQLPRIPTVPAAPKTAVIQTTKNLNLRKDPGAHFDSLAVLAKGTAVTRTAKASGVWWK